jgi:hypothetical protein
VTAVNRYGESGSAGPFSVGWSSSDSASSAKASAIARGAGRSAPRRSLWPNVTSPLFHFIE